MKFYYLLSIGLVSATFLFSNDEIKRLESDIKRDWHRVEDEARRGYRAVKGEFQRIERGAREEWDHLFEHHRALGQSLHNVEQEHAAAKRAEDELNRKADTAKTADEAKVIAKQKIKVQRIKAHLERVARDAQATVKKLDDHANEEAHDAHVKIDNILHEARK